MSASASIDELKARTRASYPYSEIHQTRWTDNDQYGHVNNSIYQHYFDTVINSYLIGRCGLWPGTSSGIGLAVATSCEYFRPVTFPQRLWLGLRVVKLGTSSAVYEIGVFEAGEDDGGGEGGEGGRGPAAVGRFTHVFVDRESRKARGMAGEVRAGLEKLLVGGGNVAKPKL